MSARGTRPTTRYCFSYIVVARHESANCPSGLCHLTYRQIRLIHNARRTLASGRQSRIRPSVVWNDLIGSPFLRSWKMERTIPRARRILRKNPDNCRHCLRNPGNQSNHNPSVAIHRKSRRGSNNPERVRRCVARWAILTAACSTSYPTRPRLLPRGPRLAPRPASRSSHRLVRLQNGS